MSEDSIYVLFDSSSNQKRKLHSFRVNTQIVNIFLKSLLKTNNKNTIYNENIHFSTKTS